MQLLRTLEIPWLNPHKLDLSMHVSVTNCFLLGKPFRRQGTRILAKAARAWPSTLPGICLFSWPKARVNPWQSAGGEMVHCQGQEFWVRSQTAAVQPLTQKLTC
jgi:hypothetical protein